MYVFLSAYFAKAKYIKTKYIFIDNPLNIIAYPCLWLVILTCCRRTFWPNI